MWYTLVAIIAGLVVGFAARGSFRNMALHSFRMWALLPAGVVVQAVPDVLDTGETAAFALLLLSYVFLAGFAVANLRLVGMAIILIGLTLNLIPIAANRGMPVRADAVTAANVAEPEEIPALEFDPKHHLETADDEWMLLADIIPVRPLREVLSFGDLVMSFGVANVIFRLMKPAQVGRRRANDERIVHTTDGSAARHDDELRVDLVDAEARAAATAPIGAPPA